MDGHCKNYRGHYRRGARRFSAAPVPDYRHAEFSFGRGVFEQTEFNNKLPDGQNNFRGNGNLGCDSSCRDDFHLADLFRGRRGRRRRNYSHDNFGG